jgi:hypothetical protein
MFVIVFTIVGNIDNLGLLPDERIQELKRVYENVLTLLRQHMMNAACYDMSVSANRSSSSSSSTNSLSPIRSFPASDNVQIYSKLLRMLPSIFSVQKPLMQTLFCACVGLDVDVFISAMITGHRLQDT